MYPYSYYALVLLSAAHGATYASCIKNKCPRFSDAITQALGIDLVAVPDDAYLVFRKAARLKGINPCMPADEFNHIYRLDRVFRASDIIKQKTGFIRGNSASTIVHHKLATSLLTTPDSPTAVRRWRNIDRAVNADPKWKEYHAIADASAAEIAQMHATIQAADAVSEHVIIPDLVQRIYGPSASSHKSCDDRQLAQKVHPKRNLDHSEAYGLTVEIPAHKREQIKAVAHLSAPLIESTKNSRILTISGLRNSKVSLLVHDHFDHAITFGLLRAHGIMQRYSNFLGQVGNPQNCDILSREGELIASIAYDHRFTSYPRFRQLSLMSYDQIGELLQGERTMSPNQQKALQIWKQRSKDADFVQRLPIVATGVYTEIMQQRVKNGVIKTLSNGKQVDTLRLLDPEYLALMVETLDCIYKNGGYMKKQLLNTQLMVEDALQQAAENDGMDLRITVSGRTVDAFTKPARVSDHRAKWIEQNLGAISDRNAILG